MGSARGWRVLSAVSVVVRGRGGGGGWVGDGGEGGGGKGREGKGRNGFSLFSKNNKESYMPAKKHVSLLFFFP